MGGSSSGSAKPLGTWAGNVYGTEQRGRTPGFLAGPGACCAAVWTLLLPPVQTRSGLRFWGAGTLPILVNSKDQILVIRMGKERKSEAALRSHVWLLHASREPRSLASRLPVSYPPASLFLAVGEEVPVSPVRAFVLLRSQPPETRASESRRDQARLSLPVPTAPSGFG